MALCTGHWPYGLNVTDRTLSASSLALDPLGTVTVSLIVRTNRWKHDHHASGLAPKHSPQSGRSAGKK